MDDTRASAGRRVIPATVAGLVFLGMAVLYLTGRREISDEILGQWGVDAFSFPFVDTDTVLSAVRCLHEGVDVFVTNPCDPVRRVFDYSPLWLLLAKLPVTEAWITPAGIVVGLSFILSLLLLPAGRSAAATAKITVGAISTAVVFAVERGNNDVVLFVLAAIAAALAARTPVLRLIGYAAALLAGLLKYYPITLMAMATRERPARFFAVAAASVAVVGLFLATMGHDLVRALKLIPVGQLFGDMFGSGIFPGGLARLNGWPSEAVLALRIGLAVGATGAGVRLALRPSLATALDRLTEAERMMLLAGGLLIISCYFTANNIGYRALHLVLTLPALTALSRMRAGRVWTATTYTVLAVLFSPVWRNWITSLIAGRPAVIGGWAVREALWWWTVAMLIALVFALLRRSEMGRRLVGRAATPLAASR